MPTSYKGEERLTHYPLSIFQISLRFDTICFGDVDITPHPDHLDDLARALKAVLPRDAKIVAEEIDRIRAFLTTMARSTTMELFSTLNDKNALMVLCDYLCVGSNDAQSKASVSVRNRRASSTR
jgi:hypothetical protein